MNRQDLDHLYETIYDHGNGKYLGEASKAQREQALQIIESLRYELDAMSAIKEERDECYVVMRQALEALESKYIINCGAWRVQQDAAIDALRERLE
jgi:hypothetical protein